MQGNGFRQAALTVGPASRNGFTQIDPSGAGILFSNRLAEERSITNQVLLNGSGVAAGDMDGDGRCDLFFCGLDSPGVLYRNLGGFRFADITLQSGLALGAQASTGAAWADVDGNGSLDLLVNGVGTGTRLFLNDGKGHFRETTDAAGLRHGGGSSSLALADIDGDGWLDLYVVNYRRDTMRDMPETRFSVAVTNGLYTLVSVDGQPAAAPHLLGRYTFDKAGGVLENGEADVLYRNLGQGHFSAVSWTNGAFLDERGQAIEKPFDWGLSALFRDLDGDGAPDLYVCNDFQSPDRIWMNDGHGRFRALAGKALRQTSLFSMGVAVADVDRDGYPDIFVADMLSRSHQRRQVQVMDATAFRQARNPLDDRPQFSRNTLFHNRGNGTYAEIAQFAGIDASDWSWCPVFLDVDLDGYEDLLITTGHWRDAQNVDVAQELDQLKRQQNPSRLEELRLRRRFPRLATPNVAFRNRQDGTFEEVGREWGFDAQAISQGMALADLDGDGDLDVIINCFNAPPLLYRNEAARPRVAIRLRGQSPNTRGIGARVEVTTPGLPVQSSEIICGGRYLSSDEPMATFAAGQASNRVTITVRWRSGRTSRLADAPANHAYELDEPASSPAPPAAATVAPSFFEDVSDRLEHQHVDAPFDDFARQPLLPRRFSELGPGVTWFDFNGDGYEDLFIGAGRGGRLGVFRNDGRGRFVRQRAALLEATSDRDLTSILGWRPSASAAVLLMGLSNYEDPPSSTPAPALRQLSLGTGLVDDSVLRSPGSTGPLAAGDFDGDGDLDVFVGGRLLPGRYPAPASSFLLRNDGGRLVLDELASASLKEVGLVSGAVFTDLDGDGVPELVLACEWGPVKIFRRREGKLQAWDPPVQTRLEGRGVPFPATLGELTGWWNSVATGDLDGDGRPDLVLGNWGRNHAQQRHAAAPLRLLFGESPGGEGFATLAAGFDPDLRRWVPMRDWGTLKGIFPRLQEQFPNYTSFSTADLTQVMAAGLPPMQEVRAAVLDSLVLLNRGDHFEAEALPAQAQWSPVFGIAVADLDGDGYEDLFLAQNFFGVASSESRHDAGDGLWLRGNGRGEFAPVPSLASGFGVYGEGRGVAVCDFDHDGRLDLAVGQNRGATKLYHNRAARPGVRVHLQGPAGNPQAVGAVVRGIARDGKPGPAHEIRLGGGYWSQDSTDAVITSAAGLSALEIRWPHGKTERVPLAADAASVTRSFPSP